MRRNQSASYAACGTTLLIVSIPFEPWKPPFSNREKKRSPAEMLGEDFDGMSRMRKKCKWENVQMSTLTSFLPRKFRALFDCSIS